MQNAECSVLPHKSRVHSIEAIPEDASANIYLPDNYIPLPWYSCKSTLIIKVLAVLAGASKK